MSDLLVAIADESHDARIRLLAFSHLLDRLKDAYESETGTAFRLDEARRQDLRRDPASGYSSLEYCFFEAAKSVIPEGADSELEAARFRLVWEDRALPFVISGQPDRAAEKFCAPITGNPDAVKVSKFAESCGYGNFANLLRRGCGL